MSRLVARLRSKHSRLLVQFNDLKKSSEDKIKLLGKALEREKNGRLKVQEDRFEKRSQLLTQIETRERRII